jgi:hypothetical protein
MATITIITTRVFIPAAAFAHHCPDESDIR